MENVKLDEKQKAVLKDWCRLQSKKVTTQDAVDAMPDLAPVNKRSIGKIISNEMRWKDIKERVGSKKKKGGSGGPFDPVELMAMARGGKRLASAASADYSDDDEQRKYICFVCLITSQQLFLTYLNPLFQ